MRISRITTSDRDEVNVDVFLDGARAALAEAAAPSGGDFALGLPEWSISTGRREDAEAREVAWALADQLRLPKPGDGHLSPDAAPLERLAACVLALDTEASPLVEHRQSRAVLFALDYEQAIASALLVVPGTLDVEAVLRAAGLDAEVVDLSPPTSGLLP